MQDQCKKYYPLPPVYVNVQAMKELQVHLKALLRGVWVVQSVKHLALPLPTTHHLLLVWDCQSHSP